MNYPATAILTLVTAFCTYAGAPEIVNFYVPQDSIIVGENCCDGVIILELSDAGTDSFLVGIQLSSDGGINWNIPLQTDYFIFCSSSINKIKFRVPGQHGTNCIAKATVYDTLPTIGGMRFIPSMGHTFLMGSEDGPVSERPSHQVKFTYNFLIDTTEITIVEFMKFKPDYIPALLGIYTYQNGAAADNIFWHEAFPYCNRKSIEHGLDTCYSSFDASSGSFRGFLNTVCDYSKNGYRLPTEAEWEYACRAGSMNKYYWGGDSSVMNEYVWSARNFADTIHAVATKLPNRFGLYDMNGNGLEMTNDWYDSTYYAGAPVIDPVGPPLPAGGEPDPCRVVRGGHVLSASKYISSSRRLYNFSSASHMNSFRCVRTVNLK